jgi:endogenous inhibitor of DNA gyrase (YacG/DUF329 family)
MKVPCPICKKLVTYYGNEFRPFCSARCKTIDLGDWASGKYAVPVDKTENDDADETPEKNSEDDHE